MKTALVVILALALCGDWLYIGWQMGHEQGQLDSIRVARKAVEDDMSKHCTCWFTGSKCRTPNPTVICTKPEWMK